MTVGSRINTNFPIPGVDQSSRGFRDNFATIKHEIESLQGKHIQLSGSLISDPIEIGNGSGDIVIPVNVSLSQIQAAGNPYSVQYNFNNVISGSTVYYRDSRVGINTNTPAHALDVVGNARIASGEETTLLVVGGNLIVTATPLSTAFAVDGTNVVVINNSNLTVGIGTSPNAVLDVYSPNTDVAVFRGVKNDSDNGVRFTTSQPNSTFGLVLEQRAADSVGGIRIDQTGAVSIHVAESMDANLSDASRVINILANNNVGIGSMSPKNQLDVQGNAYVSGHLTVGTVPVITGSRGGNAALFYLLAALQNMGLIKNNTIA